MRVFAKPGNLQRLSLEARVVYSVFCLFLMCGLASSIYLFMQDGLHLGIQAIQNYYLGSSDLSNESIQFEKTPRQLVETFHFHVFMMSLCFLVIAHLFMMISWKTTNKVILIALAACSTLLHLLAPFLIRFCDPSFAVLVFPSMLLLIFSWLCLTLLPLIQMWTDLPRSKR